jgi:SulP family sulfate permease
LPKVEWIPIDFANMKNLIMPAVTIAVLAAIESLLSAVVADGMIDDKHNSNQELIAQGMANVVTPFFGGIPATGAIARTATNIKNGGKTPIAGVVHCIVLLCILLFAAPYAQYIPLATLSAVLFVVAFNMGDWSAFKEMSKLPRSDDLVFMCTFLLTVVFGLTLAIEVGMVLAAMLFIRRVSQTTNVMVVDKKLETDLSKYSLEGKDIPEGVMVFRIFGVLMFGAADKLESILTQMGESPKIVILRMRTVLAMDSTALDVLDHLYEKMRAKNITMMITGAHSQPLHMMQRSGFLDKMGDEFVLENIDEALAKSREVLAKTTKEQ